MFQSGAFILWFIRKHTWVSMKLTLNDVYREYLRKFPCPSDSSAANVVGVKSRVNVANQDTLFGVKGHVHAVGHCWAVIHAEDEVRGIRVSQKTRERQIFTFFPHITQRRTRWDEENSGICNQYRSSRSCFCICKACLVQKQKWKRWKCSLTSDKHMNRRWLIWIIFVHIDTLVCSCKICCGFIHMETPDVSDLLGDETLVSGQSGKPCNRTIAFTDQMKRRTRVKNLIRTDRSSRVQSDPRLRPTCQSKHRRED